MKKITALLSKSILAATLVAVASPNSLAYEPEKVTGWGEFKIYLDPGHEGTSNAGLWGYSEAQKVLRVALTVQEYFQKYTDMPEDNLRLCRYTDSESISLEERSDAANAWGADFYYSIHSDAGATQNLTVLLFGGWKKDGVEIEKTPNGGKAYGEILDPNLSGVMRIGSRGNWYDRCFYERGVDTHTNQFPYLSVNRRSNMPSLLSEGGYHTIQSQQQLNMNDDYKRLEGLAAFQSLLQYHGIDRPQQTALAGIIRNAENDQPINGVKVTMGDRTYTTNTWESTFKPYTTNPDLIHNGFYYFENVDPGSTVEVKFECEGFEPLTTTATIKAGGATTPDYVTFLDVNMTNIAPAKVESVSITDPEAVTPIDPLVITFSRNMDRASVEQAFSINNNGKVELSWRNDYTLLVDLSQLLAEWNYTITIDGSIAKNSATNQLLDGDGDGAEGGNYTLNFTMAEPDYEAPYVINTYPADGGEAVYDIRPVIGIEFNEIVAWNEDAHADLVTVTDSRGKVYPGRLVHAVSQGKSFLQYYLSKDLPADRAVLVTLKAGLPDQYGNTTESDFHFRFLTEYRDMTSCQTLQDLNTVGEWWAPGGSGSTSGLVTDESTTSQSDLAYTTDPENTGSMQMHYVFDMGAANPNWFIRLYWNKGNGTQFDCENAVILAHVYSDCSNNSVGIMARNKSNNGLNQSAPLTPLDFRGWRPIYWEMTGGEHTAFTNDGTLAGTQYIDSFCMKHEDIDPDDEELPFQEWEGTINFDELCLTKWDTENSERNADINDIAIPESGVAQVVDLAGEINFDGQYITVATLADVNSIEVYTITGAKVAATTAARLNVANLGNGVYVVRANTNNGAITAKIVK